MKQYLFLWLWNKQPLVYCSGELGSAGWNPKTYKNSVCVEKQDKPSWNLSWQCPENASSISPKWATMLKEMSFGCTELFFSSSVFIPCCKQSLETEGKSSFSSITGFECDFECLLMWDWHISSFLRSSSPSVIYTFVFFARCCLRRCRCWALSTVLGWTE